MMVAAQRAQLHLEEWQPLDRAVVLLTELLVVNGSTFILHNWDCKYIDARIDMRTGNILLRAGNVAEGSDT